MHFILKQTIPLLRMHHTLSSLRTQSKLKNISGCFMVTRWYIGTDMLANLCNSNPWTEPKFRLDVIRYQFSKYIGYEWSLWYQIIHGIKPTVKFLCTELSINPVRSHNNIARFTHNFVIYFCSATHSQFLRLNNVVKHIQRVTI